VLKENGDNVTSMISYSGSYTPIANNRESSSYVLVRKITREIDGPRQRAPCNRNRGQN